MGFIDSASFWSRINGFDYYENGNVLSVKKINDNEYHATIKGSKDNIYEVVLNPKHPKKSSCTCPRAKDKFVVCKHKVAVFYAIHPNEAQIVKEEREKELKYQEELEEEYMVRHQKRIEKAKKYVESLSIEEMKQILIDYKITELEEYEEQFYESPDDFYW